MSVSPSYRTFVLEQLGRAARGVRARAMFGGLGIYAGDCFFALVAGDILYFKVDDSNRPDFEARGSGPFRPYGEGGETMRYYEVPEDLLEDVETLRIWIEKAVAVARRAKAARSSRAKGVSRVRRVDGESTTRGAAGARSKKGSKRAGARSRKPKRPS